MSAPRSQVSAVLLAAGDGRRLGQPKALVDWGGEPLVRHQARTALAASFGEVLVVAGAAAQEVAATLADLQVRLVEHPGWEAGLASSVVAGLGRVSPDAAAALFLPVDQPLVDAALLDRLVAAHAATRAPIVLAAHRGRWRSPRLFDRRVFPELSNLRGDAGGRQLTAAYCAEIVTIEVDDEAILTDVDTPEDLARLRGRLRSLHASATPR